jgi:rod shape-determining protein MreD
MSSSAGSWGANPARMADGGFPVARFFFAILLLATALLQATFLPALHLLSIIPDFALVFLLIWSASHGATEGMFWAFGLGLWMDFLTLDRLGTHSIALLTVAAVGGASRGRLFRSGAILPLFAVVVATLAFSLASFVVMALGGETVSLAGSARLALLNAALNALLVPLAYVVLLLFERWMPRRVS